MKKTHRGGYTGGLGFDGYGSLVYLRGGGEYSVRFHFGDGKC